MAEVPRRHDRAFFALTILSVAAIFCADSFIRVPVPGVNEPHYICKARAHADADWCVNDFFLQSSNAHAVFYWLVGPLTRRLDFASVAIVGRVVSLLLLAVGWTLIGRRLQLSSTGTLAAAAVFCAIATTGNFSGEWIVGGFESKVPAYGFALIATALWLGAIVERRWRSYAVTGGVAGIAVALHPVVGLWFCIGIAMTEVALWLVVRSTSQNAARVSVWKLFADGVVFAIVAFVTSLPGLLPALRLVLFDDASPKQALDANLIQVFYRLAHHLDPTTFSARAWVHTGVLLGIVVAGGCLKLRSTQDEKPEEQTAGESNRGVAWKQWFVLLSMSLLIAAVGILIGWHEEAPREMPFKEIRASLLKLYAFRFFDALLPVTVAFVISTLVESRRQWTAILLLSASATLAVGMISSRVNASLVVPVSGVTAVVVFWGSYAQKRQLTALRFSTALRCRFAFIAVVIALTLSIRHRQWSPNSYNYARYVAWQDACNWLQQNTPTDALVHTPRESFGLKWFAERAEYVCFKDCPQDTRGILEWNRRLWTIHRWAEAAYEDEVFNDSDLRKLSEKTGVTWLMTRRLGPFESAPAFENDVWRIYSIGSPTDSD